MTSRRTIAIVGIGLVVLLITGVFALLFLPASIDYPRTEFKTANASVFESSGSLASNGETILSYEGAVGPNGTAYKISYRKSTRWNNSYLISEVYEEDGISYKRVQSNDSIHVERQLQNYNATIINRSEENGEVTAIFRAISSEYNITEAIKYYEDRIVMNLETIEYDKTGDTIYEPQNGWYDGISYHRVTNANGTLRTDSTGTVVMNADVDFHRTLARKWLDYFLNRDNSSYSGYAEINYEYQAGSPDIETPEWVAEVRANQTDQ